MTCAAEISEQFAGFTAADPQDLDIAQDLFDQGCVYIIEFSEIRANSGALWERTHLGVFERLQGILRRLLPSPIYRLTGADHTRCVVAAPGVSTEIGLTACVRSNYELFIGLLDRCELSATE